MLSGAQLFEVVLLAAGGLVVLVAIYFAAGFILSHIGWIFALALGGATAAVVAFSRNVAKLEG